MLWQQSTNIKRRLGRKHVYNFKIHTFIVREYPTLRSLEIIRETNVGNQCKVKISMHKSKYKIVICITFTSIVKPNLMVYGLDKRVLRIKLNIVQRVNTPFKIYKHSKVKSHTTLYTLIMSHKIIFYDT